LELEDPRNREDIDPSGAKDFNGIPERFKEKAQEGLRNHRMKRILPNPTKRHNTKAGSRWSSLEKN